MKTCNSEYFLPNQYILICIWVVQQEFLTVEKLNKKYISYFSIQKVKHSSNTANIQYNLHGNLNDIFIGESST